jgi:pilus assembly protein CpaB
MRKLRPALLIAMSLAFGAMAVVIALNWITQHSEIASTRVVVASRDLGLGTQLREDMLEVIDWPVTSALKGQIAEPKDIYQRVINTAIAHGEPVLSSKLAALGEKGGLSAMLHEGTRAVTVKVNEIVGVAGFALPGNYVDVMVNATDKSGQVISKIVLERILVLALAQDASTSETKPRVVNSVTLEVMPAEAEKIDLARSIGSLSLVLRSQVDKGSINTTGSSMDDLFKPSSPKTTSSVHLTNVRASDRPEIIRGAVKTLN